MIKYSPVAQLSISEFQMPFETVLDPSNRWVLLSKIIPWDKFADLYYREMSARRGAPTIDARIILGVVVIKHLLKLDDRGVIEMIQENPYMQYFLGLKNFTNKPVFDPSLLVSIRKRLDLEIFESLTEELITKALNIEPTANKENKKSDDKDTDSSNDASGDTPKNKGKLQLDATVADADIKYPTDLDLLNDSREKSEDLIDTLCKQLDIEVKPRTYRKIARKEFLNVSKKKKKSKAELRRAIRLQINYVKRNIKSINTLLDKVKDGKLPFNKRQYKYFLVIQQVLAQQEMMYRSKTHSCDHRIVSIHQPHVRPIVRGKAKAKVEFGAKVNISLQDGFARIDRFEWEAFNEGGDLIQQVERHKDLFGHYPELVQVDKIYLTKTNRVWLKEKGIRYTGEPLGRKPTKTKKTPYQKRKEQKEFAERNHIEGKFGQGKNGYNLNHIRARLAKTSVSWIAAIFFVMNLIRYCNTFFVAIWKWAYRPLLKWKDLTRRSDLSFLYDSAVA